MAEGTRKNPLEYQREYNEFMHKLKRYLASKDMPMKKLPQFGGQDIDLYLLYKTVTNFGGCLKVTDDCKWHEVAKNFNLPQSCLNSAFALRQLYVRYLQSFEKLYFLGEDGEDTSLPRPNLWSLANNASQVIPQLFDRDPLRNFERLVLSLQSGLPNEVDFAMNICMLLSNVNNSVFSLVKAPTVIDMILAHVGIFDEDPCGSRDLYLQWYKNSGKDFLKFWQRVLNCEEIKQLLPTFEEDTAVEDEDNDVDSLFNLEQSEAHKDFELQRVLQVCTILHNFSFDKTDSSVLSSHPMCIRFLMLCLHSKIGSLKKLATDTIANLADKMILEPVESLNSQLLFFMIDSYLNGCDRYNRLCAINVLRKLCLREENHEFICNALDVRIYEVLVTILLLEDVQLLIASLEALYQLTNLGQVPCDYVVAVERSIEILVTILHVCVESFNADMLAEMKVVDNYQGTVVVSSTASAGKHLQQKSLASSSTTEASHVSDAEAEVIAHHWLRNLYDVDSSSSVLQRDLYADYMTSCGKTAKNTLNVSSFFKIVRSLFPNLQIVKLSGGGQTLYAFVGMRRKLPPGQYFMQAPASHPAPLPQASLPPSTRTMQKSASAPMDPSHFRTLPTSPAAANIPNRPQSPFRGQRHDAILAAGGQSGSLQSNVRPVNSASLPVGMSASEYLGSLAGSKQGVQNNVSTISCSIVSNTTSRLAAPASLTHEPISVNSTSKGSPVGVISIPNSLQSGAVSNVASKTNGNHASNNSKAHGYTMNACSDSVKTRGQTISNENRNIIDKTATVNGTGDKSKTLNSCSPLQTSAPVANGPTINGALYVGEEESAAKVLSECSEVVISVVENSRATTRRPSDEVFPAGLVSTKKRPPSILGDVTAKDGEQTLLINGPFVASEMLRNVAKRQRKQSQTTSHLNGSSEQKGVGAWDEIVKTQAKPPLTLPKLPIAVNGVRLDVLSEPIKNHNPGTTTSREVGNMSHSNTNAGIDHNTEIAGNGGSNANASVSNFESTKSRSAAGDVAMSVGNSSSVNAVLAARKNADVNECSGVVTESLPSVNSREQTLISNSVTTVADSAVRTTVGISTPQDEKHESNSRVEKSPAGVSTFRCLWAGCDSSFSNSKLLYNHLVSVHAPKEHMFTSCQWEGCNHVRRSRSSLLFHLRQRHLSCTRAKDFKPAKTTPPASSTNQSSGSQPTPPAPAPQGRPMYHPHPSVNPLLLNLKEQLLHTEQESPLTKSARLTSALVLRNIARYSQSGRRRLKRFESSFAEIICSKVESSGVIAVCLHELTRLRKENTLPKR